MRMSWFQRPAATVATDHFSKFNPKGRFGKFFNFPLSRVFVFVLFLAPILMLNSVLVFQVVERLDEPLATRIDVVRMLLNLVLLIICYRLYCKAFERRRAVELGGQGSIRHFGVGALLGGGAVVFTVAILFLSGSYTVDSLNSLWILPRSGVLFGVGAFFQDLIFLCVIFRLVEEFAGTWMGTVASLGVFALVHAGNPNATAFSTTALFLSSIVILAPFVLTRRLWVSWGFHAAWNFTQSAVFGMANSGFEFDSWIVPVIDGPAWLTGGNFGIEGSWIAISLDVLIGCTLFTMAIRRGQLVSPRWKRVPSHAAMS